MALFGVAYAANRQLAYILPLAAMLLSDPEFAREARRQSLAVARSPQEKEDQAFVDAVSEWPNNAD